MGEGTDTQKDVADAGETSTAKTAGARASTNVVARAPRATAPRIARYFRQQIPRMLPWMIAMVALILAGMTALLLADTRTIDAAVRPTPTATPSPTATQAPTATPQPIDGFQFYRDPTNHYIIQYPLGWVVSSDANSQSIEFCDDCNNPGYFVQVITPSNLGDVGPPANQNTSAGWVTYALDKLSAILQSGTLTTLGPQKPITIGGVVWQSGGGLVTDSSGSVRLRVQVYATVYEDKPYILILSTTDDRFTAGTIQFFGPMLQSFEFVEPNQNP